MSYSVLCIHKIGNFDLLFATNIFFLKSILFCIFNILSHQTMENKTKQNQKTKKGKTLRIKKKGRLSVRYRRGINNHFPRTIQSLLRPPQPKVDINEKYIISINDFDLQHHYNHKFRLWLLCLFSWVQMAASILVVNYYLNNTSSFCPWLFTFFLKS